MARQSALDILTRRITGEENRSEPSVTYSPRISNTGNTSIDTLLYRMYDDVPDVVEDPYDVAMQRIAKWESEDKLRNYYENGGTGPSAHSRSSYTSTPVDNDSGLKNLWTDTSVRTTPERDELMDELRSLQWTTRRGAVERKNEIRARLQEIDEELGNAPQEYGVVSRSASTLAGGAEDWAGKHGVYFGKISEALARLGEKLGSNTSDYAGWATDEMSAAQIGNENDPAKRAQQIQEAKDIQKWGTAANASGQERIERAKSGTGALGRLAVDLGANAVQMGLDAGTAALTGGSGALIPLFTRAAGGGMLEAEKAGASLKQQLLYGTTVGAIEAGTEMLTGGLAKIYGAGGADELIERTVRKMVGSDIGRKALLVLADMGGEGLEEIISDIANPYARMIYDNGEALKKKFGSKEGFMEALSEEMYDGLVGALMGGFGSVTKAASGDLSRTVQRMGYADTAEGQLQEAWGTDKANQRNVRDYAELIAREATGEDLAGKERAKLQSKPTAMEVLEGIRSEVEADAAAEEHALTGTKKVQLQGNLQNAMKEMLSTETQELTDTEARALVNSYETGTASAERYAYAAREAYLYGQSGMSEAEAKTRAQSAGDITPEQFSTAWKMGALKQEGRADKATEEGRTALTARLASLGTAAAEKAAEVYEPTQTVERYGHAMTRAADLYASHGADLQAVVELARSGDLRDSVAYLTDEQVKVAQEIGEQLRTERIQSADKMDAEYQKIREQATELMQQEEAAALSDFDDSILQVQDYIGTVQEELNATIDGMEQARKADPGVVNTPEYQQLEERVQKMRDDLANTRDILNKLVEEKEKARAEYSEKAAEARKGKGGQVTYASEEGKAGGMTYKAVDRESLSKTQKAAADVAETIAKATGLDIRIADFGNAIGGEYMPGTGGVLYLNIANLNGKNISVASLSHELTHWLQEYAPKEYEALKEFVLAEMAKNPQKYQEIFNRREQQYQNVKGGITTDEITDEMVANACQTVLQDAETVQRLVNEHRTLAERIRDFILKFVEDIKAAFAEIDTSAGVFREVRAVEGSLDQIRELWLNAFEVAGENLQAQQAVGAKNTVGEGNVQMQKYSYDGLPANAFYTNGKIYDYDFLVAQADMPVATMPSIKSLHGGDGVKKNAVNAGIRNAASVGTKVSDTVSRVKNAYTKRDMQVGKKGIEHGLGAQSGGALRTNTRIAAIAGDVVKNGIPINGLSTEMDGRQVAGTYALATMLRSDNEDGTHSYFVAISTIEQVRNSLETMDVFDVTHSLSGRIKRDGRASRPEPDSTSVAPISTVSIADFLDIVNETHRSILSDDVLKHYGEERPADGYYAGKTLFQRFDSTGTELTEDQAKFFEDSKIRDDQGRLKVMYRGGDLDFTVFDRNKSSYTNLYGRGFYFTEDKSRAGQYGRIRPFYLNIKNPLQVDTHDITRAQLRKFLNEVAENEDYGLENYGYGATVDSVLKSLKGKDDFGALQDINATAIGDFVAAVELFNEVNGTDYDGIVAPTETVAFRSEQIKNIDNKNPTNDPDVRFQMISDVEESDRLIAVHNKTMSGLRRMIERGGVPYPSIAIKKAGSGHNHYGPVSIVFGRDRIDPEVNRANRIYGGDAWTPTEPRTEYEADSNKAYKIREQIRKEIGSQMYEALRMGGSLDEDEIERKLGNNEGNIFKAMKDTAILKYAYLKSIGKEPKAPTREKRLDGFNRYTNEQLLNLFKTIGPERIRRADYSDQEFRQKAADILNEGFIKDFRKRKAARGASKEAIEAAVKGFEGKPVYSVGNISVNAIQDALRVFENDGRKLQKETDSSSFTSMMRDNKDVEGDPGYRKWIESLYSGIIKNSGIRNDKDVFTPSGSRRSFKQLHVPATLDNIVKIMSKQNEKGVTSFAGSNLMGTGTKTYRTVEEARADRGRLYNGDYIDEEEFEGPKKVLNERLQELVEAAAKISSRDFAWEQRDSTREILLEAVRDSKTKQAMDRKLRKEAQWINYDPALTEELWQLAEDTRNMKVPYFEAKLRRIVYPEEALAYIVEDTAEETDADLLKTMRDMGLNVLTYKAGDKEDRLRVLNSVEGSRFQILDDQLEMPDVTRSGMHPEFRQRVEDAEQLQEDVVAYFRNVDPNSDSWLSEDDIREALDYNAYAYPSTGRGDMSGADQILQALSDISLGQSGSARGKTYRLMERILPHMGQIQQGMWTGMNNNQFPVNEAFANWYNKRHPSLYYPGYTPGEFFGYKPKAFDAREKERAYLHKLIESGDVMEPELSEARDMLEKLNGPRSDTFYQIFDDTYDDTDAEQEGRSQAYSRLASENVILNEALDTLGKIAKKYKTPLGKVQKLLQIGDNQEVREKDAKKLARTLLREYGSTADAEDIAADLKYLGDYMLQKEDITATVIRDMARDIAGKIIEKAEVVEEGTEDETLSKIRDRIKSGPKLRIDAGEISDIPGYDSLNQFRRRNFGRINVVSSESKSLTQEHVSVDDYYQELQEVYGTYYFPELTNQGEMLGVLERLAQAAEPETVNPFEQYMGEATEDLANRITADALGGVLRMDMTTPEEKRIAELEKQGAAGRAEAEKLRQELEDTRESKSGYQRQAAELNAYIKQLVKAGELQQKEAAGLWQTVYELSMALDKAQSRYKTLQTEASYREAQVRTEGAARAAEAKAKERARGEEKIQALKDHFKKVQKNAKERREESAGIAKYRKQVQEKAGALYEMLVTNSDKKHVPEALKKPVKEFLESLNFTSKRRLRGGEETNADKELGLRMRELERALSGQQDYIDGRTDKEEIDLGGYVDISEENMQFLRDTIEMIDLAMKENRDFTINQMTGEQLKQLSNFLSNLNAAIRNLNNFMANARFESVREAAAEDVSYFGSLGEASQKERSGAAGFLKWLIGTPFYVFKRFGKGGQSIFGGIAAGWDQFAFDVKEIKDFAENLYTTEEVNKWKNTVHHLSLDDGTEADMTTAQIMELAMLLRRDQALKHITKGGFAVAEFEAKNGRKKVSKQDLTQHHLSADDVEMILGLLSSRQLAVAEALQHYMAVRGAELGNEISMRRFGYKFYTEGENYYPIKTMPTDRPMSDTDLPDNASMFRLLNLSSSKSLNPKANNALVVGDIFDTFASHMSDMAKLHGLGLPILDAIKWFNYKVKVPGQKEGEFTTRTVQAAMLQAYGSKATGYFRTLMKDINGTVEAGDRGATLPAKAITNYKIASVGANLRVALLQPTSYVRASAVIKPQFLAGVIPSRKAYEEALKYAGTAVWKDMGFFDTDVARGLRDQIKHDATIRDKLTDKAMWLAEMGDKITWSMLWTAAKRQTAAQNPGLRGVELAKKTNELFRETIYATQIMDSTLTRSELMRSRTTWDKSISAFMAEPTLSYNILMGAYSEYQNDARQHGRAEAWARHAGKFGKAFAVYTASAMAAAIVESFADALRDDDDDEFLDKFLEALIGKDAMDSEATIWARAKSIWLDGNLGQDMSIIGKIPFFKDIMSMLQGYDVGNMSTDGIESLLKVKDLLTGNVSKRITPWGKIYKYGMQPLSWLSGLPVANLSRDVVAVWNNTVGLVNPNMRLKKYNAIAMDDEMKEGYETYVKDSGISMKEYMRIMEAANTDGNTNVKQDELGAWMVAALERGEITEEQAQALWKSKWNKASSNTFDKWRGKAPEATSTTEAPKTESTPAATPKPTATPKPAATPKPDTSIRDYDGFKKAVPIYERQDKENTYAVWSNYLQGSMSLDRYVELLKSMDLDDNDSLKQDELGTGLVEAVRRREMTQDVAAMVWAAQGWKHDFNWWLSSNYTPRS